MLQSHVLEVEFLELIVTCEFRFFKTPDGQVWTTSAFQYGFWQRYLTTFEQLKVVARVQNVEHAEEDWKLSSGDNVSFCCLPYYVGIGGLLKNLWATAKILRQTIKPNKAIIYRVPSQTAMLSSLIRLGRTHHYGLEVVGDPSDVFESGIVNGVTDKILGWVSRTALQRMVKSAHSISYVTKNYLQQRYPANQGAYTTACSSIELQSSWISKQPQRYNEPARRWLFVGSFGQLYKGPDLLINALATLNETIDDKSQKYQLTMLGDGIYKAEMQTLAKSLGCGDDVNFVGEVNAAQVKEYLSQADVFVMPSRTEGLPRALIEAMATGLPAIGSRVGGIPELLADEHLFESENTEELTLKLGRLCCSVDELNQASERNIQVASTYEASILNERRQAFYQQVKKNSLERK